MSLPAWAVRGTIVIVIGAVIVSTSKQRQSNPAKTTAFRTFSTLDSEEHEPEPLFRMLLLESR